MSDTVDDRVVALKFDNKQFESASAQSMSTLDKLKKSLDFQNANKSLTGLQQTAGKFNMGSIATTIEGISAKFLAMGTIGVTALVGLTQQALATGTAMAKALTIDPLQSGYGEYSTNLNSIQTILSNTVAAGTDLKDVNKALAELNDYSDKTIYNFSEMARNIGTFTAAGVNLETSTNAIKGIANLAALSGSSAQQASTAMYQLSQAISTGTVKLIDWNSVSNAGMGGAVFQRALAKTAVNMGKLSAGAVTLSGDMETVTIKGNKFRDSLSAPETDGWLTSDVLTKTLSQFTGDMTDAQLAAEGWSKAEIKAIQKQAKAATEAATQVKTVSQAFDVAKETAGSGWAKTWQIIFGNFETAKKDMTAFSQFLNGIINENADARNALLGAWSKAGGRIAAIQTLKAALEAFTQVLNPIKKAWKEVFPPTTGQQLKDLTVTIRDFFRGLKLGPQQVEQIKVAFKGFFTILSIGKQIISGMFGFVKDLFGIFTSGSGEAAGGILEFVSSLGANIIVFSRWLKSSNAIPAFFDRLYRAVAPTVIKIKEFVGSIKDAVGGALGELPGLLDRLRGSALDADESGLTPLQKTMEKISGAWGMLTSGAESALNFFKGFADTVKSVFAGGGDFAGMIQGNLEKIDWPLVFKATVGAGFVASVGLWIKMVWTFIQGIKEFFNIGGNISEAFAQVGKTLEAYQKTLRANTILMIAAAILAIAVAIKILSTIPVEDLLVSVGVLYIVFEMLDSAFKSVSDISEGRGMAKVPVVAASLLLIAGAMVIFALAIKLLGSIPVDQALQGMALMGGIVLAIVVVAKMLEGAQGDILRFSAGLYIMANAMIVFAAAIFLYSKMDMETFVSGGGKIVIFIAAMATAMHLMPKEGDMLKAAAGLLLIALALNMMIIPIKVLGAMDFDQMINAVAGLGLMLTILVLALNAMTGTLAGAAAMLVASASLVVFAVAIKMLSEIGFGSVILGILGIVIAMAAIAGVATLLAPLAPAIAIFGAALLVLGAGFALLGAGALGFALAMSIIITIMSVGMPILEDTIENFIKLIPLLAKAFQTFLEEFANAFTEAIPEMVRAIETLIREIINAITRLIPDIADLGAEMFKSFIESVVGQANVLYEAAWSLLSGFLRTINRHLPDVIKNGKGIIITLIKGFGKASEDIIIAAGETMLDFMEGITTWIDDNEERIGNAGRDLAGAIISGFASAMTGGLANTAYQNVSTFFGNIISTAQNVLDSHSPSRVFIRLGRDVTRGFAIGIGKGKQDILDSMASITEGIRQAKLDAFNNIQDLKKKINDLKNEKPEGAIAKKANAAALAKAKADLAKAEAEKKKLDAAYLTITKERKKQIAQLVALGKKYDTVKEKLDAAKDAYKAAIQERDDYAKNVADQYSALPDIPDAAAVKSAQDNLNSAQKEYNDLLESGVASADELSASITKISDAQASLKEAQKAASLDAYFDKIRETTAANLKFKATLEELRKLGLDDNQYKKFMEQGTDIQPFLDQLLAAGGGTIAELNKIDATLTDSAESLGKSASEALYQAGVDSAKGLVDGLTANLAEITAKMKTIGKAIADEIKKELGIKSPSKVFREIGKNTVIGLAEGLDKNSGLVNASAQALGQTAVDSLKASLTGLSDVIASDLEMNPTIAPVLDLDAFRKDSARINDILNPNAIRPTTSAMTATAISNEADLQAKINAELALVSAGNTVMFEQNNYSPKALSTAETYRQTKNLLSITKGALGQ